MSVFVDTSALYALMVETEQGHRGVAAAFRRLLRQGGDMVTSNYVLVETTALLQRRFGMPAVRDFDRHVQPVLDVVWITEPMHHRAVSTCISADRRGLSLVDCTSFLAMDAAGIDQALALDRDFAGEGYRVLPT